ncbi:SusC/RagA family TonB-linked outer membrane protein [Echinicola sp. CAU 1574]|uniref:SusC/RagA family TonB-linked outer membrane protein n=1 Tax=Echinicola arenosa TaxID=2774144 RepID=A0ABR9AMD7_9BACT|nr:SusC/RagA family TonB-linked outer membrane protein [Echinicola arenosa]MBD8489065.1 SusC/RagA family TonB-linked outer membrane protein [Echinicola arenosa]
MKLVLQTSIISRRLLLLVMFLATYLAFSQEGYAQQSNNRIHITGSITNQSGESLPGATVLVKGTLVGISAGPDGNFTIDVPTKPNQQPVLVVSFIGFKSKEITLGNQTKLKITLEEDINTLDDVTVIAYGKRSKEELISSVASVKSEDIQDMPAANLENLLQGQMAGVAVTNQSGSPGGTGTIINIRGQNSLMVAGPDGQLINDGSPLYVVDGIPIISETNSKMSTSGLADIDPSTIESVEVLKDASAAALYGSRANNGVILITTKQGKEGKAEISANVSMGFSILPRTPVQTIGKAERDFALLFAKNATAAYYDPATRGYSLPTSYEDSWGKYGTYDYFWGNGRVNGLYQPALQDSLNSYYNNSSNWWDYFFRTGKTTNSNVQINGGSELMKYNLALGHYDEEGIMVGTAFERYNFSANLTLTPRKNLTITSFNYFAYTNRGRGSNSNNGSANMVGSPKASSSLLSVDNSIAREQAAKIADTQVKNNTYRLRSGLKVNLNIAKGLSFTTTPSVDFSLGKSNIFTPSYLDDRYGMSQAINQNNSSIVLNWENLLNYFLTVDQDHEFEFLAGQGLTRRINETAFGMGRGMASDDIHYVPLLPENSIVVDQNGNQVVTRNFSSTFSETYLLSYFGRIAYNYKKKYLIEASIRTDGSSTFGEGKRWGTFPSVATGWNFSEEPFMDDVWWLNQGKLRGSWGITGLQFQNPYLAHGTVSDINSPYFMGQPGLAPDMVSYNNLAWEQATQYDIGLDLDFLDYRLRLVADYYYKYNDGQIYDAPFPGNVYYLSSTWRNTFSTSNQGIELGIQYDVIRDRAFTWNTKLNIAKNTNRFEESYNGNDVDDFILGRPIMGFNVYIQDGYINSVEDLPVYFDSDGSIQNLGSPSSLYPAQVGMKNILDLNSDGRINDLDKTYVGSPIPKMSGGWTNDFKYKNFGLNMLFTYTLGRSIINAVPYSAYSNRRDPAATVLLLDYRDVEFWNQEAFENAGESYSPFFPTPNLGYAPQADVMVNTNIEQVNWIRLKKLNLSYTFDEKLVKKLGITSTRLFFTAENLMLITNYSGLDPEAVPYPGVDQLDNYPLPRVFTAGCTLKF